MVVLPKRCGSTGNCSGAAFVPTFAAAKCVLRRYRRIGTFPLVEPSQSSKRAARAGRET
jgi:hypothetical protein